MQISFETPLKLGDVSLSMTMITGIAEIDDHGRIENIRLDVEWHPTNSKKCTAVFVPVGSEFFRMCAETIYADCAGKIAELLGDNTSSDTRRATYADIANDMRAV